MTADGRPSLKPRRWVLPALSLAAAAWLVFLAVLAATTANESLVSERQVLASPLVVAAVPDGRLWKVTDVLRGEGLAAGDRVTIEGVPPTAAAVLPLSRTREGWTVTALDVQFPNGAIATPSPTYPDTPAVRETVRSMPGGGTR